MSLAEQVYEAVMPLSESMAQEFLDFALFLRQREEIAGWLNLQLAQSSALQDGDNQEDEVWNDVPAV